MDDVGPVERGLYARRHRGDLQDFRLHGWLSPSAAV
jgi:hypothetical protein